MFIFLKKKKHTHTLLINSEKHCKIHPTPSLLEFYNRGTGLTPKPTGLASFSAFKSVTDSKCFVM